MFLICSNFPYPLKEKSAVTPSLAIKNDGICLAVRANCLTFALLMTAETKMKANEQTRQQIERFINKVAQKFAAAEDEAVLTDIHVRVSQESGELLAFDDDDQEITRCVVEQWIDCKDEDFEDHVLAVLRDVLKRQSKVVDDMAVLKPYSWVLENDDNEALGELYLADDDTVIVSGDLMEGLDKELDDFFSDLMKDA